MKSTNHRGSKDSFLPSPRYRAISYPTFPKIAILSLFVFFSCVKPATVFAATCLSKASGNWNANTTWFSSSCANGNPGVNDTAIISTHQVTVNISTTVSAIELSTPTMMPVQLTQASNAILTVTNTVKIYASSGAVASGWNINGGTATVGGQVIYASTRTNLTGISSITVTSGQLDANGGITFTASTAPPRILLQTGSASLIRLKGALTTNNSSSYTATAGTFNYYDSASAQTISSFSTGGGYFNLYANNTSAGGATLGFNIGTSTPLVMGDLKVQTGTLKNGGLSIVGRAARTFEVDDGAAFELSGSTNILSGFGTYTYTAASTLRYLQSSGVINLSTNTTTYGNLEMKPAGTVTQNFSSNTVTIAGNLLIGDGSNAATVSANASSTTLIVNGNVTINSNSTLVGPSSNPVTVGGNFSNSGTYTPNRSTVTFTGAAPQLTGSATFFSLTSNINNQTLTFQADSTITVLGVLNLAGSAGNTIKLRSSSPTNDWYLVNTGSTTLSFVDAQDSNAFGGRTIRAFISDTDSGNNTNWAFSDVPRYWAQSANALWISSNCWSYISGGTTNAPPPVSSNTVIFDGVNGLDGISSVTAAISFSTLTMTSGYSGSWNTGGYAVTISSALVQSGGTISLSSSVITLQGDLNLSGGIFTNGFSTVTLSGGKSQSLSANPSSHLAHLLVNKTGGTVATLNSDLVLDGNFTDTLGTFDTSGTGYSLTISSNVLLNGGTLTLNDSTIAVAGSWSRTSGTLNANTSTVTFTGPGVETITGGLQNFNQVIFNGANSTWTITTNGLFATGGITQSNGILTTGANINITDGGDFNLAGGTFNANSSSMSVAGDWNSTGGVFNAGGSTVTFTAPTAFSFVGSSTFSSIASNVAGQDITMPANSTITVLGFLTMNGVNGNPIVLRSSTPSTPWYLVNQGTNVVTYVDTQDSYAFGGKIVRDYTGGIDSGNNINWVFTDANRYWVQSALSLWTSTFSWSYASGGTPGASPPSSSHTVIFDGVNGLDGISSVTAAISISTLTMTSGYAGSLNLQGFGVTVTSAIVQSGGTLNLSSSAITLQGDLNLSGGTFTNGFSTVTLTGGKSETLSATAASHLAHLVVNKTGGTIASLGSALSVDGNLTLTLGTLDTTGSNYSLTVSSNVLLNGGTLTLNGSTVGVAGSWSRTSGTLNANTSTVTFTGPGVETITGGLQNFNQVVFNGANSTWTITTNGLFATGGITQSNGILTTGANINITDGGDFNLAGGTFNANSSSMSVAGDWNSTGGVFNAGGSTVTFTAPTAFSFVGSSTFSSIASNVAGQDITMPANSTITVLGFLTLNGANGNPIVLRSNAPSTQWYLVNQGTNVVSYVDAQDSNAMGGHTIRAYLGGIDSGNNINWAFSDAYRYWTPTTPSLWSSTFSWSTVSGGSGGASPPSSSHTVVFDGVNGAVGISSMNATVSISTLTVLPAYSGTINLIGSAITISTAININGGTINLSTSVITLQGDMDLTGGTFVQGFSTITLTGTKTQSLRSANRSLASLQVNKAGGTASPLDSMDMDGNLTVTAGTFDTNNFALSVGSSVLINGGTLTLDNSTVTVTGNWARTSGTVTPGESTVTFNGAASCALNIGAQPFQNVIFDGVGSTRTLTSALFVDGFTSIINGMVNTGANFNVTIGSGIFMNGGNFQTNKSSITVLGDWRNSGTQFLFSGSTVQFSGSSPSTLTGSTSFYSLTATNPNQQLFFQNGVTQTVANLLTLNGGAGTPVLLRSLTPGSLFFIKASTNQAVANVDVKDSSASAGATILAFVGSTDNGNNFNWAFNDAYRYWASAGTGLWGSTSSWSYSSGGPGTASPPSSTNTVVFDGVDGSVGVSSVNVNVNVSTVIMTSGYTGSWNTQGLGVTIGAGLYQSGGTISLTTSAVTLQGQLNLSAGTFNSGASTFTLTGNSSETLTGSSGNLANLVLNKTAGTVALGDDLGLNGGFTLTAGTFTTSASNFNLTVGSDTRQTGGTWLMNGSTISVNESFVRTAGNISDMTSVVLLQGSNVQTLSNGATSFFGLTINKSGGSVTLANDLNIDGNFTMQSGTFAPGSRIIDVGGSWINSGGTFNAANSTVTLNSGGAQTISGNTTFDVLRATTTGNVLKFQNGNTNSITKVLELRNATLQSTTPGSSWLFNVSATSITLLNLAVQDGDASPGVILISTGSTDNGRNTDWDFGPPNGVTTFSISQSTYGAAINLTWTATGDDGANTTLNNSTFTIQFTTDTIFALTNNWSATNALPMGVYRLTIATTGVAAGSSQGTRITGLISGDTYYARVWIVDDANLTSTLSVGATNWATNALYAMTQDTDTITFGALTSGTTSIFNSSITVTNTGNISTTYQLSITSPAVWIPTSGIPIGDEFRLTGLFKDTLPVKTDFSIADDVVMGTTVTATANIFALNSDPVNVKGVTVEPGEKRGLWFRIEMPIFSSTLSQQKIKVNVTAGP